MSPVKPSNAETKARRRALFLVWTRHRELMGALKTRRKKSAPIRVTAVAVAMAAALAPFGMRAAHAVTDAEIEAALSYDPGQTRAEAKTDEMKTESKTEARAEAVEAKAEPVEANAEPVETKAERRAETPAVPAVAKPAVANPAVVKPVVAKPFSVAKAASMKTPSPVAIKAAKPEEKKIERKSEPVLDALVAHQSRPAAKAAAPAAKKADDEDKSMKKVEKVVRGTVMFIRKNRMTLETGEESGEDISLKIDEKVKLDRVKKFNEIGQGDRVQVRYVETLRESGDKAKAPTLVSTVVTEIGLLKKANPEALVA